MEPEPGSEKEHRIKVDTRKERLQAAIFDAVFIGLTDEQIRKLVDLYLERARS